MKSPFLIATMVAFLLAACGGGSDSPTQVAEKFLTHTNKMEFKEAKKYATKATGEMLDMIAGMAGMMGEQEGPQSFTIVNESIDGDDATVTYRSEGSQEDETLSLKKEDGKWLVHMSKEDLDKEGDGGMGAGMDDVDWNMEEDTLSEEGMLEGEMMEETEEEFVQ